MARTPQDLSELETSYSAATKRVVSSEQSRLILVDVLRTYAELEVYQSPESPSTLALCRVLQALSAHFKLSGYVQGMNFIIASLKYHLREDYLTFWGAVYLFNWLELHNNYTSGLPGLHHHSSLPQNPPVTALCEPSSQFLMLLRRQLPEVLQAFQKASIQPELYLTEWILPLGHYHLPLEVTGSFLCELLEHGWAFMYRFILEYLGVLSTKLLAAEEEYQLYEVLKFYARHRNIPVDPNSGMAPMDWSQLTEVAKTQLAKGYLHSTWCVRRNYLL